MDHMDMSVRVIMKRVCVMAVPTKDSTRVIFRRSQIK